MTPPAALVPTLDALLANGERWLPLGDSSIFHLGERFLRAAHDSWFDMVVIRDGAASLARTAAIEYLLQQERAAFIPALEHGQLEPVAIPAAPLERARFVDAHFPALWGALERAELAAQLEQAESRAALRLSDGTFWNSERQGDAVVFAERLAPEAFAHRVRAELWQGVVPRAFEFDDQLPPAVAHATSAASLITATSVEVKVKSVAHGWQDLRLRGGAAFLFGETGEEVPSADYTSPYPETLYDYLPYSRAEAERTLREPTTVVHQVHYR